MNSLYDSLDGNSHKKLREQQTSLSTLYIVKVSFDCLTSFECTNGPRVHVSVKLGSGSFLWQS